MKISTEHNIVVVVSDSCSSSNSSRRLLRSMETRAEVRRIHIIYFLSRVGRSTEHPHLIRVHHLSHGGIYLRDVKRWLADLRGKNMPDSFSWSYKRRYKKGYVWQDLMNDDLITPISDNEYVLKGSEFSTTEKRDLCLKKSSNPVVGDQKLQPQKEESVQDCSNNSAMSICSSEITQESPRVDSKSKSLMVEPLLKNHHGGDSKEETKSFLNPSSRYSNPKSSKKIDTPVSGSAPSFARSKSQTSRKAYHLFRNLISCGGADTKDSLIIMNNKFNRSSSTKSSVYAKFEMDNGDSRSKIHKGVNIGGSARIFATPWNHSSNGRKSSDEATNSRKKASESANQRHVSAAYYKPITSPTCSQCGKSFKPEKMYSHMKSCKGVKALAKTGTSTSWRSASSPETRAITTFDLNV